MLMEIATTALNSSIELHISIFVTCLCNPEAIPPIPNTDVTIIRPSISTLIDDLLLSSSAAVDPEHRKPGGGGGVAVCASGPESLTREAQNAVASVGLMHAAKLGGIALHTELFSF